MGTTALRKFASDASLRAAWNDVSHGRKNRPSYARQGLDGQSLLTFSQHLDANLQKLRHRLLTGEFKFSPLQPVFVPKSNGKERLICIPSVVDRVVQRALLNFLRPSNGWMKNGVSFGFVPDLSVTQAVERARNLRGTKPWVFKTDITAFFDMIDRDMLISRINSKVRHRSLLPLLKAAVACEVEADTESLQKKIKRTNIRKGRGVRQGMALSPYFANVMLEPFDKACVDAQLSAVRYADDLAFFAESKDQATAIGQFCLTHLNKLKLEIPSLGDGSKTEIYAPGDAADFLGVELVLNGEGAYDLRVSSAQMNKIKEELYRFGSLKELRLKNLDVARFGNALESKVRGYSAAYEHCANSVDLDHHLETCRHNAIVSAVQELGIKVDELNGNGRWFLGLS